MAGARAAGVVSLVTAGIAAAALTGAAVATVAAAGCSQPGYYVQAGGHTELVGGCLVPAELPGDRVTGPITPARPASAPGGAQP